jgi:hypothetical protein
MPSSCISRYIEQEKAVSTMLAAFSLLWPVDVL